MAYVLQDMWNGMRRDMRFPIEFRAIARWEDQFAFVKVVDISDQGIRLIGESLPEERSEMWVGARGLKEYGRVVWRTAHSCGVALDRRVAALRIVRANCRPGLQEMGRQFPYDTVGRDKANGWLIEAGACEEESPAAPRLLKRG